ncbi:hypothetical protein [Flavobacterium algoritolerans]|uniref:Uncharacterized protein n=1 Tax=Flavobacterium algoritolerans TaxID=3041254 RepID=A0ABT6V987_9FLAO|nr:hypothetical protein [Flavobacterium algoritolerans]MDI5894350.1 hypothetical protein [Flavobacterium algoritolerans]
MANPKIRLDLVLNPLLRQAAKLIIEDGELRSKLEYVISEIPNKTNGKRINYKAKHLNEISNLQTYVEEKFNYIKKGRYKRRYFLTGIPLGMPIGLPFGIAIGKIGLSLLVGMPIGMIIGLLIRNYLDKKTKIENRTL